MDPIETQAHWTTKDSGARVVYPSSMQRDSQDGKPRFDLLLAPGMPYGEQMLTRWAALMERGAEKYGEENWSLANSEEERRRFRASAARHFFQWLAGERDEDHMAATCFNMMASAYMDWRLGSSGGRGGGRVQSAGARDDEDEARRS